MILKIFIFLSLFLTTSLFASTDLGRYYVNADVLKIRNGPNTTYKHSYSMYNKQTTKVYELKDGWARVSKSTTNPKWAYAKYLTKIGTDSEKPNLDAKNNQYMDTKKQLISLGEYLINANILRIRTGPATTYKHSFNMYENQKTKVYEFKDGWARISKSITNPKWAFSKYLTKIEKKAKVTAKPKTKLKTTQKKEQIQVIQKAPQAKTDDVAPTEITEQENTKEKEVEAILKERNEKYDSRLKRIMKKSDDYEKYSKVFLYVSQKLLSDKICTLSDFRRTRGWIRVDADELYFTYCGGFTRKNKIYLNLKTNQLIGDLSKYK